MSELNKEKEVAEATRAIKGVEGVWGVYGNYDIIAKISVDSHKALSDIVRNQIRQIPSVRATLTFPVVKPQITAP